MFPYVIIMAINECKEEKEQTNYKCELLCWIFHLKSILKEGQMLSGIYGRITKKTKLFRFRFYII